jgi:hypothetical protein
MKKAVEARENNMSERQKLDEIKRLEKLTHGKNE